MNRCSYWMYGCACTIIQWLIRLGAITRWVLNNNVLLTMKYIKRCATYRDGIFNRIIVGYEWKLSKCRCYIKLNDSLNIITHINNSMMNWKKKDVMIYTLVNFVNTYSTLIIINIWKKCFKLLLKYILFYSESELFENLRLFMSIKITRLKINEFHSKVLNKLLRLSLFF